MSTSSHSIDPHPLSHTDPLFHIILIKPIPVTSNSEAHLLTQNHPLSHPPILSEAHLLTQHHPLSHPLTISEAHSLTRPPIHPFIHSNTHYLSRAHTASHIHSNTPSHTPTFGLTHSSIHLYPGRSFHLKVLVSSYNATKLDKDSALFTVCGAYYGHSSEGNTIVIDCPQNTTGRWVRIQQDYTVYENLHLCEVEVFGF